MKKKILSVVLASFMFLHSWSQTPQNVTQSGDDKNESLWNSTSAIIFVAVLILLLIVGRGWSKKIHEKRDELSNKDRE